MVMTIPEIHEEVTSILKLTRLALVLRKHKRDETWPLKMGRVWRGLGSESGVFHLHSDSVANAFLEGQGQGSAA